MKIKQLEEFLELKQVKGWLAAHPKAPFTITGFGTPRLGKIVDGTEFQFSIGATKMGVAHSLNNTIRLIIKREGIDIIERVSTDGSRKPRKEYPGFRLCDINSSQFDRIINQVLGAITQIQNEEGT